MAYFVALPFVAADARINIDIHIIFHGSPSPLIDRMAFYPMIPEPGG